MYAVENKMRFLEQFKSAKTSSGYRAIFNSVAPAERRLGKDFGVFNEDETATEFNRFDFTTIATARECATLINTYQAYCNPSRRFEITKEDYDFPASIRRLLFKHEVDFVDELRLAVPFNQGHLGVPALCMAWVGIKAPDAGNIPENGVCTEIGAIYNDAGDIVASRISGLICSILDEYHNTIEATRTQNYTFTVTPLHNGKFLHQMVTRNSKKTPQPIAAKDIIKEVSAYKSRIQQTNGSERLTYGNVYKSGQLYRLHSLELTGANLEDDSVRDKVQKNIFKGSYNIYDNLVYYRHYKDAFRLP